MTYTCFMKWPEQPLKRYFVFIVLVCGTVIVAVFLINLTIKIVATPYIYNDVESVPEAQVVIIPGAAILPNGALSSIFIDRADMAIKLYVAKKVSKILVSGDNSTTIHNEVNPVRLYLISKGVPDQDIFLDHAGFDTYSTMYRARDIFEVNSILISTQSFHLPRAVFIARALGIEANGVNADVGHMLFRNKVREVLANEKAVFDLLFQIKPKFLGEKISISDDGRNNP